MKKQGGSVLLIALVFLALSSMIAVNMMEISFLEKRMATNQQFKLEASQHAEGVIRDIMDKYNDPANPTLPVSIPYGATYCAVNVVDSDCEENSLYISAGIKDVIPSSVDLLYRGTRLHSEKAPAVTAATASSGQLFHYIEISADYNGLSNTRILVGIKISQFEPGTQQFVDTGVGGWGLY